jgi:Mg2+/Co2+ transporter CorB
MEPHFDFNMPGWTAAAAVLLLLLISVFFSVAETALIGASRPRMHSLARTGNRRAQLVNALRERQDEVLSAILLGNNLVNIFASAIATGASIEWFGDAGVAYAAVFMTLLVVIFGEVLPKTIAAQRSDRILLAMAPSIRWSAALLAPVNRIVQFVVTGTMHLFGAHHYERGPQHATEELRGAIELHASEATEAAGERRMLRSILDLANVEVGQIMVHRRQVFVIDGDQPPAKILEQALASPYTRIPLFRGQPDNIVGVLHARALLQALAGKQGKIEQLNVAQIATRPWFIPDSTSLLDQLEAFRRRREHFALVVDEYGALLGVVTLEDILEEIVGDIADRHEVTVPGVRPQPDGSFLVDGHVTLRDLNRQYDWRLPDDLADTVAGLVLHEARRIPDVGQVFKFHGFRFEVMRRKKNQIAVLRVTPLEEASSGVSVMSESA